MTPTSKNPRYYPADEYTETAVLPERRATAVSIEVDPRDRAPSDAPTEEVRTLSVQELERLLKESKRAN